MTLNSAAKFEKPWPCGLKNDEELGKLSSSEHPKVKLYIDGLSFSKVENAWATDLLRRYK